ncbi:MAG: molybdopterin-binding protein, partial [Oscillospiraceae bacterium]|nr:molybdopterin-binding protein [Oscillospiraceae bacterium]
MKAEIISVGTELLLGQVINSDTAYVARSLAALGIDVQYSSIVGDNSERLTTALTDSFSR